MNWIRLMQGGRALTQGGVTLGAFIRLADDRCRKPTLCGFSVCAGTHCRHFEIDVKGLDCQP
jgi:hypothetical protein